MSIALTWIRLIFTLRLPARSTVTDGFVVSTLPAVTPPQLVFSVPSMRNSALREPAVEASTLAPPADAAKFFFALIFLTIRNLPLPPFLPLTLRVNRLKPVFGET